MSGILVRLDAPAGLYRLNEDRVSFWRTSDDNIRWMVVIGLVQVLSAIVDLRRYGAGSLRWLEPLSIAAACFAAAPLEEPSRRGWPYRRQLSSLYGLLAAAFLAVFFGLLLWRGIPG